jgi:ATP-dependent Clp protease ATP-binding subunit ClpA
MFERFTGPARATVLRAKQAARDLGPGPIGTQHLLLALSSPDAGHAHAVLRDAGLDEHRVREEIVRLVGAPAPTRLLTEQDADALRTIGIDLDTVLARIEESFGPDALRPAAPTPRKETLWGGRRGDNRMTPRARKAIGLALREAVHRQDRYIGAEHLLLGLIREGDGLAARILADNAIAPGDLRAAVLARLDRAA